MKKKLLALFLVIVSLFTLVACSKSEPAVQEDTKFLLEVRAFNGTDESYNAKLDGTLLGSLEIEVKAGQVTVADALSTVAPSVEGVHTIKFNDSDYLTFTETTVGYSTSWYLNGGYFTAEPNYISGDFEWSYMAYNNHYSNGVTMDFVEGLTTYIIVVDGYDGNTGSNPAW